MSISAKGRYGLRALFDLALSYGQGPILIRDIAKRQAIPSAYLEQIFLILKKTGLVKSVKGIYGGYFLTREPAEISLKEILDSLGSGERALPCFENPQVCSLFKDCVLKDFWMALENSQNVLMQETTLADLVEKKQLKNQAAAPLGYNI